MEFYQNLIPVKKIKSKLWLSLVLFFVVLIIGLQIYINLQREMNEWIFINSFLWTIWGLVLIVQIVTGKSIHNLFGKAHIIINNESVKVKTTVFAKEKAIYWKDLTHLHLKPTFIKVTGQAANTITIDFKSLEYQAVQELKDVIKALIDDGTIKAQ